eukprot:321259_1
MSTKQQTYNPYHQPNPDQIISLTTGTEDDKQKKPIVRRTVDYHTTIINYLETRAYFPTFREFKRIYATSNAIRHMRPIPFEKSNESHGFCTKYVSTSINKHKCAINCLIWSPEGRRLITGNAMGQFTLWNGLKFNFDTILPAHEYPIRRMIWKYDDEILKWDYQYFEFNDNDKYTYYTQNEHGYSILYRCIFTSEGILKDLIQIKLPFKCVLAAGDQRSYTKALCINSTNNLLTVTMSNSFTPTNMFVIDLKSMKCNQISYVSTPGININNFVNCTLHSFKSFDGLNVSYFRYKPNNNLLCKNNNKLYPTMIVIHGGPESQYRPSFRSLIQFYTAAGFMVIAPNVRGSRGYGRTYMDADNIEKRLDSVKDIYELTNYLKKNDENVDGNRLIVYGGSYGGFMVLSCITEYPNIFICAIDIVGISNFVTFLQNTADWRRPLRESEYGSLKYDMDVLIKISPIHKINNIKCPLFIIQGDNDERVPLSESIQIYEKLKEKQLDTVLLRFDDEGHGVTKLKNKIVAYGRVLKWLINIVK